MTKSLVLGSAILEFIGASDANQQLMLEIAQALNKRHNDADQRAPLLREALLVSLTSVTKAVKSIFTEPVKETFAIMFGVSPRDVLKSADRTGATEKLYVDPDIAKVLALVGGTEAVPTQVTVTVRNLRESTFEQDAKKALPKGSDITPIELVYLIATELKRVVDRQPSCLFKKEGWNFFFVHGLVVTVGWGADSREWGVRVWGQHGGRRWGAGDAVVSRD